MKATIDRKAVFGGIASLVLTFGAASVGSAFPPGAWYEEIAKPDWTPPGWLFPPVWSLLYLLMAVSAWRVWMRRGLAGARVPLGLFLTQLVLNAGWSWIFFGRHEIGLACLEMSLLWVAIAGTIVAFHRVDRTSGLLLVPYLLWVGFALALNITIWRLNA